MTCVEIRERLDAYADGEDLSPGDVEAHLRGCPSCEAALAGLRAELASLDAAFAPVASRAEAGAARALAGLPAERRFALPWWSLPIAVAAGFLIAIPFVKGSDPSPAAPSTRLDPERATAGSESKGFARSGQEPGELEARRAAMAAEVDRLLRTPEVGCVVEAVDAKLKKLGVGCVEPAAAWVKAADANIEKFNRRMAARVVADLATGEQAGLLVEMVGDADAEVRVMAHRGLVRISGVTSCSEQLARENGELAREGWKAELGKR